MYVISSYRRTLISVYVIVSVINKPMNQRGEDHHIKSSVVVVSSNLAQNFSVQ